MAPPLLTAALRGQDGKAEVAAPRGRSFPTPFKCCGDFCGFALQSGQIEPADIHRAGRRRAAAPQPQAAAVTAMSLLFTKEELRTLGDVNMSRLLSAMEVAQSGETVDGKHVRNGELRVITYKSIAMAKGNRAHLHAVLQSPARMQLQSGPTTSVSPMQASRRRESHLLDNTVAQDLREGSRSRVFGELDGVANYYRQVRVCSDCYAVYALLDLARQMAAGGPADDEKALARQKKQQANKKHQQLSRQRAAVEDRWEERVALKVREKEAVLLRKHRDDPALRSATEANGAVVTASTVEEGECVLLPTLLSPTSNTTVLSSVEMGTPLQQQNASKHTVSMPSLRTIEASTSTVPLNIKESITTPTSNRRVKQEQQLLLSNETFVGMDDYLRGVTKHIEAPQLLEGQLFRELKPKKGNGTAHGSTRSASILLVSSDTVTLDELHRMLSALASPTLELEVKSVTDSRQALRAAQDFEYDVVFVDRELTGDNMAGLEFSRLLRQAQLKRRFDSTSERSSALLCVSSQTSPTDLQLYKDSGMDGCVGKPLNRESLHRTVHAALRARGFPVSQADSSSSIKQGGDQAVRVATEALAKAKSEQQARQRRHRRRLEASNALAMPGLAQMNARDDYVHGIFQMDAETAIPFCVMGGVGDNFDSKAGHTTDSSDAFFNLVVVHDLFDTWERLQILLQPLVARYRGRVQALLWNYPGQAYTAWRRGTLLHNTFHATCLRALLVHVTGASGGDRLLHDKPYHLVGIGNGGNIATAFCCTPELRDVNTRSLVLLNGFAHVDAQIAQFLHDSTKVLTCTPESRPDLPVYFHARFLFSPTYLARVSTPLALNLYTAVLNPITLEGRQALTLGALAHRDLRPGLKLLSVALIIVCSTHDALLDAGTHAEAILTRGNLELVDSVGKVLRHRRTQSQQQQPLGPGKRPSCVIWLPSGHEALQECKQDVLVLLEQLATGFHEVNEVPHGTTQKQHELMPRCEDEQPHQQTLCEADQRSSKKKPKQQRNFEDAFINRVLTTVRGVVPMSASASSSAAAARPLSRERRSQGCEKWQLHQQQIVEQAAIESSGAVRKVRSTPIFTHHNPQLSSNQHGASKQLRHVPSVTGSSKLIALTTWDPATPAFERVSANVVYQPGGGSKIYPLLPEVKEYMGWRVRRNQKRLQRMANMARVIQRAFRAFYARTLTRRLQRVRCAVHLQRLWRARVARRRYKGLKREDWAVRLLQRHWRGKMGRVSYHQRMLQYLAATDIQRISRGWLARRAVLRRHRQVFEAAAKIQRLARKYMARSRLFKQRQRRNASITIQRVFRGLLGRRRFGRERDKFLFAKTQAQGLAFGKQLLLEYKLFGSKLQSEVALLAREKSDVEAQAEQLVKEICEFDEGIRLLEAELLALNQSEANSNVPGGANRTLDEQAKWALREQKMRLDREFSQMLAQIAQRREKLSSLEETLARVDQERLRKEEELKALERKLVLLLEEQQQELARIRNKQETRSQLALDLIPPAGSVGFSSGSGVPSVMSPGMGSAFGSSPLAGGPTTLSPSSGALGAGSGFPTRSMVGGGPIVAQGFSQQQRQEAASLMESTETMMKFGFMSMSMTYFSSMNMVRAMRKIGAHHMTLDSAAAVSQQRWPENTAAGTPLKASGTLDGLSESSAATGGFRPSILPGGFPGQQPLQIAAWSLSDVGRWLDTLALAQYKRAFADASVDGALLLHLTDDDLRHTLGMEHRLHRKKVLTTVNEMRGRERDQMSKLYGINGISDGLGGGGVSKAPIESLTGPSSGTAQSAASPASGAGSVPGSDPGSNPAPGPVAGGAKVVVSFNEFCGLVRHGKLKQIRETLQALPERRFDQLTVATQFAPGTGTIYNDLLEKSAFHINKGDDNGNSPLLLAAQNNHLKVAQLLLAKGANPDHQNSHGHTAGHYAMAYSFFDLGAWLLDPDKGGGRDDLPNENGLTAYDGLS